MQLPARSLLQCACVLGVARRHAVDGSLVGSLHEQRNGYRRSGGYEARVRPDQATSAVPALCCAPQSTLSMPPPCIPPPLLLSTTRLHACTGRRAGGAGAATQQRHGGGARLLTPCSQSVEQGPAGGWRGEEMTRTGVSRGGEEHRGAWSDAGVPPWPALHPPTSSPPRSPAALCSTGADPALDGVHRLGGGCHGASGVCNRRRQG